MAKTPIYNLGYLVPNQDLSENLDLDELRFKAIDSQVYSLYQIFKNGISTNTIDNISWEINTYSDSNKLTKVSVSTGAGNVSWKAAETTSSKDVILPVLPSGVTEARIWLYAIENTNTPVTKDVDFIASLTEINDPINYVSLGGVVVDVTNSQISVFTEGRQYITIFSSIAELIKNHKHVGGSSNPAPIDLSNHVAGTLTGEYISNIDASKITKGTLNPNRLPLIDHNTLTNIGRLSHDQIDTHLTQLLQEDTTYQLSDMSISNRLQLILALKKQLALKYIDSTQINSIFYVPGVWPNVSTNTGTGITSRFSDLSLPATVTAATIYEVSPYAGSGWTSGLGISSSAADTVNFQNKYFDTKRDFQSAYDYNVLSNIGFLENVKINGSNNDSLDGNFTLSTPINFSALEQPVADIFSTSSNWYRGNTLTTTQSASGLKTDSRLYAYKMFSSPISLSGVTSLGISFTPDLGETTAALGSIYVYLILGSGTNDPGYSGEIQVNFDADQVSPATSPTTLYVTPSYKIFDDEDAVDFANIGSKIYKIVNLSSLWTTSLRTSIKGIGFYWSSQSGWNPNKLIKFALDTPNDSDVNPSPTYAYNDLQTARNTAPATNLSSSMFVWNDGLYSKDGKFLLRFNSGNVNTVYNLVEFEVEQPANTLYSIETRTSTSTFYSLTNLDFSSSVYSGIPDVSSNTGLYLDVLVSLNSDPTRVYTPTIKKINILFSTAGTGGTKVWNTTYSNFETGQTGWSSDQYYGSNVGYGITTFEDTLYKNTLKISDTTKIGNWVFLRNNSLISAYMSDSESTLEDGVSSNVLSNYLSPFQIFSQTTDTGFITPKDFQTLSDGSKIYCDTLNDRVVVFDNDGSITKLIQGNIRLKNTEKDFVALAAYYNTDIRKIFVAFSQNISTTTEFDSTKIYLEYDGEIVRLDDSRIDAENTGLFSPLAGQSATLEITFANTDNGLRLNTAFYQSRTKRIRLDDGAVTYGGFVPNTVGLGTTVTSGTGSTINKTLAYFSKLDIAFNGTGTTLVGIPLTFNTSSANSDYNADGAVPSTKLLGPNGQSGDVILDVYSGPIHFYNLYNPISVHYSNNTIIVAQPFEQSIVAFTDTSTNPISWTISSEIVKFIDNKIGSVYQLDSGYILIAAPAYETADSGKFIIYDYINKTVVKKYTFSEYDLLKALPGPNQDLYYVLTDDTSTGKKTRLNLMNSDGVIISTWGSNNEIIHPKGLRVLSNNDILVSE